MSSGNADAVRPDDDPPAEAGTGTFKQFVQQGPSGTYRQPDRAYEPTVTFLPSYTGPRPQVNSRHELTQLLIRSKEGLEPPLVNNYRLLRELGSGAYGTVWEAENNDTHERVAIKFFLASRENTGTVLEEVTNLREAEGCYGIISVKQVNRHGIPPHFIPNYVMSLEMGGSLQKKIDAGKLTLGESVRLFSQLSRAMAFVHTRGLLHCDLKPANILLNAADEPVVADFGQAQRASSTVAALGTFFYMAPEQATRQPRNPSTRSDVYSLGAILYTMIVGKPPRHNEAFLTKLRQMTDVDETLEAYRVGLRDLPAPSEHKKFADPLLAQLIDSCLELDPDKRPDNAGDLVRHLKHRDWWNRTKPIITIGTIATAIAILLMIGLSISAGNYVLQRSKADITREIQGSLLRDGWFGRQAVASKFHQRVDFLEDTAQQDCPPEIRAKLAAAGRLVAQSTSIRETLAALDRSEFDRWLKERHNDLLMREDVGGWKHLSLILAVEGKAFYLARVKTDGTFDARNSPEVRHVYDRDWSFRDYFNGKGNDFANEGKPHEPIRHTHISQTYQSRADAMPWLIEVSTPIFANGTDGPVVGLLVSGFNVNDDLRRWIETPDDAFPKEMAIASRVRSVLVNDRGSWVWHDAGMARMKEVFEQIKPGDPTDCRYDPETYLVDQGAGTRFPTVAGTGDPLPPILNEVEEKQDDPQKRLSAIHRDSLVSEVGPDAPAYLAAYYAVAPFAKSRFEHLRAKPWYLVVKLDANIALRPVEELKQKMQWAGLVLFTGLLAVTVALWVWLIRLLRRQEFATNG